MKDIKNYIGTKTAILCRNAKEGNMIIDKIYNQKINKNNFGMLRNSFSNNEKDFVIYLKDVGWDRLQDCNEEYPDYEIISASYFIEKDIKGKLTKEEAKALTEEYEFGERIGSLAWAVKVIHKEGEAFHKEFGRAYLDNGIIFWESTGGVIAVCDGVMNGWHRKDKNAKEKLEDDLNELSNGMLTIPEFKEKYDKILEKYEVKEK